MTAFYNECDPFAAQWLRNLISAGHIAPGIVDERPIQEIEAFELSGFTQCHFFAGIGVWSHALRRAGWPDERPIWTGSCPCQPFSNAGTRKGISDERHLWPYWHPLIEQRKPSVVIGEQVASKDGLGWLDLVSTDMEASDYAFGASDLCAAGFDGAHIRQRLYFVGLAESGVISVRRGYEHRNDPQPSSEIPGEVRKQQFRSDNSADSAISGLENPELSAGARQRKHSRENLRQQDANGFAGTSGISGLADDDDEQGSRRRRILGSDESTDTGVGSALERSSGLCKDHNPDAPMLGRTPVDWLYCRDEKWRPVEPGTFPLVDAAPARVGRLRAYGNALDAETATEFCRTVKEICDGV